METNKEKFRTFTEEKFSKNTTIEELKNEITVIKNTLDDLIKILSGKDII